MRIEYQLRGSARGPGTSVLPSIPEFRLRPAHQAAMRVHPGAAVSTPSAWRLGAVILVAALLIAASMASRASDLGFTPSHVYSMWESVNNSLVAAGKVASQDRKWLRSLRGMKPRRFTGKAPADVLRQVAVLTGRLNTLRRAEKLDPVPLPNVADAQITPSHVFLSSGRVQDGVAQWFIRRTKSRHQISPLYAEQAHSGKTPSDVYGLVDLANRRMARILAKLNL